MSLAASPAIWKRKDGLSALVSVRPCRSKDGYGIVYAHSAMGERFEVGGNVFKTYGEWENEMAAYPNVTIKGDKILVFYSGNAYKNIGYRFGHISDCIDGHPRKLSDQHWWKFRRRSFDQGSPSVSFRLVPREDS